MRSPPVHHRVPGKVFLESPPQQRSPVRTPPGSFEKRGDRGRFFTPGSFDLRPDNGPRIVWTPPGSFEKRPEVKHRERIITPKVVTAPRELITPKVLAAPCEFFTPKVLATPHEFKRLHHLKKHSTLCPLGHELQPWAARKGLCDGCWGQVEENEQVMDCRRCNWYLCWKCLPQHKVRPPSLWGALSAMPFYAAEDLLMNFAVGSLRTCLCSDTAAREANGLRAEQVLERQGREGKGPKDLNPKWLLDAVHEASPSMVTFVQRKGDLKAMGVEVFMDRPDKDALEIYAMFGPGMGEELFEKAVKRARDEGRRDLIAHVSPGAREAYLAHGFKVVGPMAEDKTYPMRKRAKEEQSPAKPLVKPAGSRSRSTECVHAATCFKPPPRPKSRAQMTL